MSGSTIDRLRRLQALTDQNGRARVANLAFEFDLSEIHPPEQRLDAYRDIWQLR